MNCIINIFMKIHQYICCIKKSSIQKYEIEIDDKMEYHLIYD